MSGQNTQHRWLERALDAIERTGNRLPHPALVFIFLGLAVLVLSSLLGAAGLSVTHPVTGQTIASENLLSGQGIYRILNSAVSNFTQFAPVGVVLAIMLGVGVAEHSGLIAAAVRRSIGSKKGRGLAYSLSFIGVLSSLGADVGYVVLIPLAGALYHTTGRPALAGIAVAFAAVSAGFSANLFLGPIDVMLAGISTEAAGIVDPSSVVQPSANYYFMVASTIFITILCGWLSNNVIEPRLRAKHSTAPDTETDADTRLDATAVNFKPTIVFTVLYAGAILAANYLPNGPFNYSASDGSNQSMLTVLVPLLALYFGLAGYVFGRSNAIYRAPSDAIEGMQQAMQSMSYYLVLMFFAAQFVSWFAWSNLGVISAIFGAGGLQKIGLDNSLVLVLLILLSASINLLIGSASAKWALIAPVFVPMLLLVGIDAEQTQMAYRIGDSASNIITPLMPYFGIVLAYAQRYEKTAGLGSIIATMLPYSISLLILWTLIFISWIGLGIPLGF